MIPKAMKIKLSEYFFAYEDMQPYAIVDGVAAAGLLDQLEEYQPEHRCLFDGTLHPDLAEMAPYLIKLQRDSRMLDWLLDGWGQHYGIYALVPKEKTLSETRAHFKNFMLAERPDGKVWHFRYYDPRIFRLFLPSCTGEQLLQIFGDIKFYFAEGEEPHSFIHFWPSSKGTQQKIDYYVKK